MMRVGILIVLVAAACGAKSHPPAAVPSNTGGGAASASSAGASGPGHGLTAPTEPHSPAPVMLKDVQSGDTACWLVIVDDHGQESEAAADYEVCPGADHDATKLIGQRVTLTWAHGNVIAASCNGNPDCTKSDSIDLVETVTPAP